MVLAGIDSAMEIICVTFSTFAMTVFIVCMIIIWKRGVKLEKNLKVVLVIEGLAIFLKAWYNY